MAWPLMMSALESVVSCVQNCFGLLRSLCHSDTYLLVAAWCSVLPDVLAMAQESGVSSQLLISLRSVLCSFPEHDQAPFEFYLSHGRAKRMSL